MKLFDERVNEDDIRGIVADIEKEEKEFVYSRFDSDGPYKKTGRLRIYSNIEERYRDDLVQGAS